MVDISRHPLFKTFPTPVGPLTVATDGSGICRIVFGDAPPEGGHWTGTLPFRAQEQIEAYFGGKLREFFLPLSLTGSPFDLRVWTACLEIPCGKTATYAELAARLGAPRCARAVGGALGRNPVPLLVPCHRVVGAGGKLTGFAGGVEIKRRLLDMERESLPGYL